MYAESKGWKTEMLNANETGLGGFREVSFMIDGDGAYSRLKFESGVHRVQRVPETESSGRIHTSTVTVAVLPEVEDVDVEINPADIRMEVFRASGAGGQHVNKTSSAVRLIHEPTGIVAECQTERSQLQNREYAMRMLRSKIYDIEREKQEKAVASERRIIGGHRFANEADFKAAERDLAKIEEIKKKIDYNDPKSIEGLYNDLQTGQIVFESVIGQEFDDKIYEAYIDFRDGKTVDNKVTVDKLVRKAGKTSKGNKSDKGSKRNIDSKSNKDKTEKTISLEDFDDGLNVDFQSVVS
jgi:protein subunit release factor B